MGYRYSDYKKQAFTATEVAYEIGIVSGTRFVSLTTLLLASQDCQIKINNDTHWEFLHANIYYDFEREIVKITVKRDTVDGNLEIWAEGSLAV